MTVRVCFSRVSFRTKKVGLQTLLPPDCLVLCENYKRVRVRFGFTMLGHQGTSDSSLDYKGRHLCVLDVREYTKEGTRYFLGLFQGKNPIRPSTSVVGDGFKTDLGLIID